MTQDPIYSIIGQYIVDCIPEDFRLATLNIEAFPGSVGVEGTYEDESGVKKNLDVHAAPSILKHISKFYKKNIIDPNFTKWNRAVATLTGEHKFNIQFIWDQALQDKIDSFK